MTQDERWKKAYQKIMQFMEKNQRRPSKYCEKEMNMVNWIKYNKKMLNKGLLPDDRQEPFAILLETAQKYRRANQYG